MPRFVVVPVGQSEIRHYCDKHLPPSYRLGFVTHGQAAYSEPAPLDIYRCERCGEHAEWRAIMPMFDFVPSSEAYSNGF